ncbi:MAG: LacI family DNA-binding transcriptional regulator [Muribaculaceae bacterium]|nr:LacI family DNA-binding transcriptional regulator [Muribaculaceae bacterium]
MAVNDEMTMKDIARELGVSVATVSRALKDSPSISKERREKIQAFAREHNYVPNAIAEQLRNSRKQPPKVIGVILPEFIHYYFATVLAGIEDEASKHGYRLLVAASHENEEREKRICESFYKNKVCGIITSQAKETVDFSHYVKLDELRLPLVFYDRICPAINANRVVVDDYVGTLKAVSHLIDSGCKRIAFYGTTPNLEIGKNRFNGYKDALYQHGLTLDESLVRQCDTRQDAERITPEMLKMKNRPDAFFTVNDETAIGVLYTVKQRGFKIPEEISICGFTNSTYAVTCDPQLTSVEQNGYEVGREAAESLIGLVEGTLSSDHVVKRIVKTRLVVRATTK